MRKTRTQSYVVDFDRYIFFAYLILAVIGLLVMLDISSVLQSLTFFYRQFFFFVGSMLLVLFTLYFPNLMKFRKFWLLLLLISVVLLVAVLVRGVTVKGATRRIWGFQPSFLARFAIIFLYAHWLDKKRDFLKTEKMGQFLKNLLVPIIVTLVMFILIILERHLSTVVISGLTIIGMLYYAGIRKRFVLSMVVLCIIAGIGIIKYGPSYRSDRITVYRKYALFIRDDSAVISSDLEHQVKESITALTSGGLKGTGISRGRAKHFYLPEARTDYVYTIIGEQFGYLGALIVLFLQSLLFFRMLRVSHRQDRPFLMYLAAGLAMNIYINALVNMGVSMSILPPTGNTLPFISYGGSAYMIDSLSVGMVLNMSAKRKTL